MTDNSARETRHVGIQEFVVLDVGEEHGPPSQPLLRVALLPDGQVSLAIEKYDENAKSCTYTRVAQVIVDLEPLYNGLAASVVSEGRKER